MCVCGGVGGDGEGQPVDAETREERVLPGLMVPMSCPSLSGPESLLSCGQCDTSVCI